MTSTGRISLHTFHLRLSELGAKTYDDAHATIPDALDAALRRAGARAWSIWRSGDSVFQCIDVDDVHELLASLAVDPDHAAWQERMAPLFTGAATGPLPLVWSLPDTAPTAR
jgi:L-rhamnose mutarotase